jgi:hypothetical protein
MRSHRCAVFVAFLLAGASASAAPFPSALAVSNNATGNTAYTFTTTATGGTGQQDWSFKLPGPGVYLATFAANFIPTGSRKSPVAFSCVLVDPASGNVVQSSTLSIGSVMGWDAGVSGSGIVNVKKGKGNLTLSVICGSGDDSPWSFEDRPLEVTFVKLAGQVNGALTSVDVHRTTTGKPH